MRKAFADTLTLLGEKDEQIVFITGDLGYQTFDEFKDKFGQRYINAGIAEMNMVAVAAGLAIEGFKPVIYSIASFMTGRAFEAIRVCLSYHNLSVIVVGAGGGYCYSSSGPTHHAADDFSLMNLLPNMSIAAPGAPEEVERLLPTLFNLEGPSYIRIGKYGEPRVESESPVVLGKARMISQGERVAVLTVADTLHNASQALTLLQKEGVRPALYQFHTLNPFDYEAVDMLVDRFESLIIVEETLPVGGLFTLISQYLALRGRKLPNICRLGPDGSLVLGSPNRESLRRTFNMDAESIAQKCAEMWASNPLTTY